jgi:hypothetical protein
VAKENSPTGRYYAAIAKRLELARRRADFRAQVGSDYARQQELQKKGMSTGDAATLQEAAMIEQNLDENKVELPETSWDAQKAGNDRIDAAMQRAGNFDACDWTSVTDVMPTIAYQLATDPDVKAADIHVGRPTGVTPDEVQAVRAKRVELARLLGTQYRTDAQLAKEKENQRAASAPASAGPMGPYNECMQTEMKPINDYVEKHKAELDAAQEKNDMTKLMQFADTQQKIMAKASMKCAPLMKTQ